MSLRLVEKRMTERDGIITIEGDTMEEVQGPTARSMAIRAGQEEGLPRAGTSGGESAYPVDADGNASEDVMMGRATVAAYRCDFKVTAGL